MNIQELAGTNCRCRLNVLNHEESEILPLTDAPEPRTVLYLGNRAKGRVKHYKIMIVDPFEKEAGILIAHRPKTY